MKSINPCSRPKFGRAGFDFLMSGEHKSNSTRPNIWIGLVWIRYVLDWSCVNVVLAHGLLA